jgi:hypothetical protein
MYHASEFDTEQLSVPEIPNELLDQFVTRAMTAEAVEAVMRILKKAVLDGGDASDGHEAILVRCLRVPSLTGWRMARHSEEG